MQNRQTRSIFLYVAAIAAFVLVYYLIAGMMVFLGLLCAAGGVVIMMLGGSFIFWGSVIFLLSLTCFLIGTFYIHMGRSAVSSK